MITCLVHRNQQGEISSIQAKGHAEYADKGQDIVCAAAVAVCATCITSVRTLCQGVVDYKLSEGDIRIAPEAGSSPEVLLLLESCSLGLKQLAYNYEGYIEVIEE